MSVIQVRKQTLISISIYSILFKFSQIFHTAIIPSGISQDSDSDSEDAVVHKISSTFSHLFSSDSDGSDDDSEGDTDNDLPQPRPTEDIPLDSVDNAVNASRAEDIVPKENDKENMSDGSEGK